MEKTYPTYINLGSKVHIPAMQGFGPHCKSYMSVGRLYYVTAEKLKDYETRGHLCKRCFQYYGSEYLYTAEMYATWVDEKFPLISSQGKFG